MKRLLFFGLSLLTVSTNLYAQKKAVYFFNKGLKAYNDSNYRVAQRYFCYVIAHYPHSQQYYNSIVALGSIYYLNEHYTNAEKLLIPFFTQHIKSNQNVFKRNRRNIDKNYMHNAAFMLSSIFEKEKKYTNALHYLALAYKTYPTFIMCNFDREHNNIMYAIARSRIYNEMGNYTKAEQELLSFAFHFNKDDKIVFMDNLKKILLQYNDKQQLKKQLNESLHRFIVDTTYDPILGKKYTLYITFMNTKMDVKYISPEDTDRVKIIRYLKDTPFYQMVQSL